MDFNKIYLLDKPGQFQHSNVERKSHVARGYIYIYIYLYTHRHTHSDKVYVKFKTTK